MEDPRPLVDGGRYRAKAVAGDTYQVAALIFRDGPDILRAVVKSRPQGAAEWREEPLHWIDAHEGGDRWAGSFPIDVQGIWEWTVEAWTDAFASWRSELERKVDARQPDLSGELSEGMLLLRQAAERATGEDRAHIEAAMADGSPAAALDPALLEIVRRHPDRSDATTLPRPIEINVDRGRFGSWYELFPRSWGGFAGVERQLPRLAELGFDVLYLPPIHPIGRTNRKGRNNSLNAGPDDPGSPWAIGLHGVGGHTAIHPDLGTDEDFRRLVVAAREHGIEIALDFAIQCSADHPWLTEHPEWFNRRPDGTLKYAENPPKKYQDIYNVNWDCDDWRGLWQALLDVVLHWVERGVTVFRVDNPHTKPTPFWEWLIAEVRREHPDVIFLAEAFTRRAKMDTLAKVGFNQSYTYFTWKNARWELIEYVVELAYSDERHYFRPNFFVNTPDILTEYLQHGGRPAFEARLVLGATLSPTYGIYSGFENVENVPVRPGSEEYLDSEKYEIKHRSLDGPLLPLIQRVNEIRRAHQALHHLDTVTFLDTANEALVGYAKRAWDDIVICVVNIDPRWAQEGVVVLPAELGLPPTFSVVDELGGDRYTWHLGRNYVRLEPGKSHVLTIER
ncbi:MAG: alpha-1,4-glucan--maltose-1-phosphate maltosyltransferase [Actinobacteria bacterium]|nr:MAG: alpha-1,4-glucan--maltose-1-phosphate maltosyltransferase [Actinomycetota bacterium]